MPDIIARQAICETNLPRGRHCPKCQSGAAKAWLAARKAELLPVSYFHLVFTLPKPIADIALQNKRAVYNLLMRASADTVLKIAADPKHLGARVGITSVLHTWGSAMTHHPQVHMIVPGERRGGAPVGSWLARMLAKKPKMLVAVALANKMARTAWALITRGGTYEAPIAA